MSELPDLSAQKPYALDQLAQLQGKIIRLSQSMVLQRARIERCRQSDLAAARDIYAELSKTREALVEALAQTQLFLMETEEYALAKVSGQLRQGLAGFALMSTGYKSVYEALSRFASSLPVGQKTNAAVVGRLMNNIKLGYYPTDPDNIALLLRGIKFPEGVTTNLLDPCCGCGKALRQLAQGNNCYAYGVELDESRAEEAQTRLHRVGFGSFFHSSISREAFHLLFLNPPYLSVINENGGRSRHEKRFLIESLPALAYGGLLIYVIPYYRLTPDICRILVDNFDDLTVWRFTESEFRKFKQVAVLGVRKPRGIELQDTLWLEELASAPMSIRSLAEMPEERYALPDHPIEVNTFKGERFNQKELEQQLRRCNSFAQMMARSELDSGVKRPLLPLSISQIGLIGGSGMDKKAADTFAQFKEDDLGKWAAEAAEMEQRCASLAEQASAETERLRAEIQTLTADLEYGNLSQSEYDHLGTCREELRQSEAKIAALQTMTAAQLPDFDREIAQANASIAEIKRKMANVIAYISKRAELTFSQLKMNRVEISLYDVVKSTGEVKDTFKFQYGGRRYDRLSLSEKIRAGMEVSELMKRLTGRNYPVFVDNMESVDDLANVRPTGQIIMAKCVSGAALQVKPIRPIAFAEQRAA